MKILIINGPNLNLLGKRQTGFYGNMSFEEYLQILKTKFSSIEIEYFQNNHEGAIIDRIHSAENIIDGIVLNAGAYSHTSIAIADAIQAITVPVIEVHISNVYSREKYRHFSYLSAHCKGTIVGLGLDGYRLAIENFVNGNINI
jgi:3-dehydroquinate dehydratase-2